MDALTASEQRLITSALLLAAGENLSSMKVDNNFRLSVPLFLSYGESLSLSITFLGTTLENPLPMLLASPSIDLPITND